VIEQDLIPAERAGSTPERKPQLASATISSSTIATPSMAASSISSSGIPTVGTNHQVHQPLPQRTPQFQPAHTAY
jgi:hypothetical protein